MSWGLAHALELPTDCEAVSSADEAASWAISPWSSAVRAAVTDVISLAGADGDTLCPRTSTVTLPDGTSRTTILGGCTSSGGVTWSGRIRQETTTESLDGGGRVETVSTFDEVTIQSTGAAWTSVSVDGEHGTYSVSQWSSGGGQSWFQGDLDVVGTWSELEDLAFQDVQAGGGFGYSPHSATTSSSWSHELDGCSWAGEAQSDSIAAGEFEAEIEVGDHLVEAVSFYGCPDDFDLFGYVRVDDVWVDGPSWWGGERYLKDSWVDADGDGVPADRDCDDTDPEVSPCGVNEIAMDGIDNDCNGEDRWDEDGDGYTRVASGGEDCDDADASIHPRAKEVPYDGVDQDCSGADLTDVDGDGWDGTAVGGEDCDDGDASVAPDAVEIACDGVDQDCDGEDTCPTDTGHPDDSGGGADTDAPPTDTPDAPTDTGASGGADSGDSPSKRLCAAYPGSTWWLVAAAGAWRRGRKLRTDSRDHPDEAAAPTGDQHP